MIGLWIAFFAVIALLLAIDLGIVNKKAHVIGFREAAFASLIWIAVGVAFSGVVWLAYEFNWAGLGQPRPIPGGWSAQVTGIEGWSQYMTAYLVEESLSVDNLFVMAMLFSFFKVPQENRHRVLFWGILGAIITRGLMIGAGSALVASFGWIFYVFGAVLLYTAWRMLFGNEDEMDPENSRIVKIARRLVPLVERYDGDHFFIRVDGRRVATLLFLALIVVEATDIVFAVDSIPAIFGFTSEPFIIMTSNIMAILGLRSLYFVVASAMREFRHLKAAVSVILLLVGIKMFLHDVVEIPAGASLAVVAALLGTGVLASIAANRRDALAHAAPAAPGSPDTGPAQAAPPTAPTPPGPHEPDADTGSNTR